MSRGRRTLCKLLFVLKATTAISLAVFMISYFTYIVAEKYQNSVKPLVSIEFPALDAANASLCYHTSKTARLEPPENAFFFGFSLQWDRDLPQSLVERMDMTPALINTFIQMDQEGFEENIILWQADLVQKMGGFLEITLMLKVSPEKIPPQKFKDFAALMRKINSENGVAVLLRFLHEMNGPWMEYGMKPFEQKQAWNILSKEIRAVTNLTALVWSPNIGGGYPFVGAGYDQNIPTQQSDPVNFQLLDTNRDGYIDNRDEPYAPYYPGDDIVDWVGISLYSFSRQQGQHVPAPHGLLTDPNGVVSLYGGQYPYYPTWVEKTGKPFMFSETGAAIVYDTGSVPFVKLKATTALELQVKQRWWSEILAETIYAEKGTKLSRTKAAVWFEEFKNEFSYDDSNVLLLRDYRISYNSTIRNAFKKDYEAAGTKISRPGKFKFGCNGEYYSVE